VAGAERHPTLSRCTIGPPTLLPHSRHRGLQIRRPHPPPPLQQARLLAKLAHGFWRTPWPGAACSNPCRFLRPDLDLPPSTAEAPCLVADSRLQTHLRHATLSPSARPIQPSCARQCRRVVPSMSSLQPLRCLASIGATDRGIETGPSYNIKSHPLPSPRQHIVVLPT
jgi:hypothetical protein